MLPATAPVTAPAACLVSGTLELEFDFFAMNAVYMLVLDVGKIVGDAARDLHLTETALREWVRRAQADPRGPARFRARRGRVGRTPGADGLTTAERDELAQLRKENRESRTERDILKKPRPSSRSIRRKVRLDHGGEGRVDGGRVLSRPTRVAEWLLCVAGASGLGADDPRSAVARPGARPRCVPYRR